MNTVTKAGSTEPGRVVAENPAASDIRPLPCPFCGSNDIAVVEGDTFRWLLATCTTCRCCGAKGPGVRILPAGSGTKEEWERRAHAGAIAEWNKRPGAGNLELEREHGIAPTRGGGSIQDKEPAGLDLCDSMQKAPNGDLG